MTELKDNKLYYVGGVVRDRLLGVQSLDTDYCYEGNAIEFAKEKGLNIIKENPSFGTVRVLTEDGEIDIASTRTETYPKKGHLPKVKNIGCSVEEDLKRRDFTINAIAMRTSDNEIIDIFGGRDDIKNKTLRVLHENSFIDDPTRIIRALKFGVRFGFRLSEESKALQDSYLNNINYDISWHRLKKELVETFSLNKQTAYDRFVNEKLYKLLGEDQNVTFIQGSIEDIIANYPCQYTWLVYLGLFNLSNLPLNKTEKRIIEWTHRLMYEKASKNTPFESLLIHKLRIAQCSNL